MCCIWPQFHKQFGKHYYKSHPWSLNSFFFVCWCLCPKGCYLSDGVKTSWKTGSYNLILEPLNYWKWGRGMEESGIIFLQFPWEAPSWMAVKQKGAVVLTPRVLKMRFFSLYSPSCIYQLNQNTNFSSSRSLCVRPLCSAFQVFRRSPD